MGSSNTLGGLARDDLQVTYRGTTLADPYVISFRIENRSRSDISSDDFDKKKPLMFNIGASIIGFIGGDHSIGIPTNELKIEKNKINIGPTLISQRHVIMFDLLVDGPPHLECETPLIGVTVREETPEDISVRRSRKVILRAVIVVFVTAIIFIPLALIPVPNGAVNVLTWITIALFGIAFVAVLIALEETASIAKYTAQRKLRNLRRRNVED